MIQNKIKFKILKGSELLWFLEGIKVTHNAIDLQVLAAQLFAIEHIINEESSYRCHIEYESKEIEDD